MAFLESLFGSKGRLRTSPLYNPQQEQALNQLLSGGLGALQNLGQFDFAPIAQQARSQFQQQTIPSIAERFTSMGGGALSSPAFASQLGQAGAGLEESLASLQSQFGLKSRALQQDLLKNLLGLGLQPRQQTFYQPGTQGFLGGAAQSLSGSLPLLLHLLGGL